DEELNGRLVQLGEVLSEIEEGGGRRGLEEGWRAMISMELPAHATQHGALHLGVGVGVNPGDPAGSALAAIHPHPQDPLALHHHNHGAATPGGMHEDSKKKRISSLSSFVLLVFINEYVRGGRRVALVKEDERQPPWQQPVTRHEPRDQERKKGKKRKRESTGIVKSNDINFKLFEVMYLEGGLNVRAIIERVTHTML
ncbi:hypothetical protein ALC57_10086, partial [Trachymyrmex cornetzi]